MTGRRSHWGWGYEDRFMDRDARARFADELGLVTGFDARGDIREPCALAEARMRPTTLAVPDAFEAFAHRDPYERALHTHGRAYRDVVRGFYGDFEGAPDVVLRPRDEADLTATLDWAGDAGIAVIPYGGGTSVVGGVELEHHEAYAGFASLDLSAMDRVLEVDETSLAARIQAGARGPVLEDQLRAHGLTLRFFPQSYEHSTLGGWIATRAGGHFATTETHIDDLVESVRMITPVGPFESRRLPASGAGPSPDRMVLGSEGAFGVITEAWVRVRPRPTHRAAVAVHFRDFHDAITALRGVVQAALRPANCRVLDQREALINRVTADGTHVLLLGFESFDHPMDDHLARAVEIAREHRGEPRAEQVHGAKEPDEGRDAVNDRWRQAFVDAPYLQNSMVSLGMIADTFETACTWDRFEELHMGIVRAVRDAMKRVAGGGLVTCRITHAYPDGCAPYFTFIAPARRGGELTQWSEIKQAASEAILTHGGTITHHHAVGRMHAAHYARQRPAPFGAVLDAVKRTLDPAGILNPGVLGTAGGATRSA